MTVANNASQAHQALERQLTDTMSLAESLNQSQGFGNPLMSARTMNLDRRLSEIHPADERRPETARVEAPTHEMANFMDNMKNMFTNVMTEVQSLVSTARQSVIETATTTQEPLLMPDLEDIPKASAKPQEECMQETHTCFKCKGTLINPKGKPCKFCQQTGKFNVNKAQADMVREEIKSLCNGEFMKLYKQRKGPEIHHGFICDGCEVQIAGIRYKCSQCADYDLCEKCEQCGTHAEHTFLKIRKARHAPAQFTCKYREEMGGMQMPGGYVDQTIDMNSIGESIANFAAAYMGTVPAQQTAPAQEPLKMPEEPFQMTEAAPVETVAPVETKTVKHSISDVFNNNDEEEDLYNSIEYEPEQASIVLETAGDKEVFEESKLPQMVTQTTASTVVEEPSPVEMKPEEVYLLQCAVEEQPLKDCLTNLFEFGFTNFARNKELCDKFQCSMEAVIGALVEDNEE